MNQPDEAERAGPRALVHRFAGPLTLCLALGPSVAAIWLIPWFVTQDGPVHVYNAQLLLDCLFSRRPTVEFYAIRAVPFPYWTSHVVLAALMTIMTPRTADRVLMTLTLVGPAAAIVWLRWTLMGRAGLALAAVLASAICLNLFYIAGFYGFLLGAALFPVTLGVWWAGRERFGGRQTALLASLLILDYFCHPVSLFATVLGLLILALATSGPKRGVRLAWTLLSVVPLIPLFLISRSVIRGDAALQPTGWWQSLSGSSWPALLPRRLIELNIYTLSAVPQLRYLGLRPSPSFPAPAVLLAAALGFFLLTSFRTRGSPQAAAPVANLRPWTLLAAALMLLAFLSPESLGPSHGRYYDSRLFLLALMALVPILNLGHGGLFARAGAVILAFSLVFQSLTIWDYALASNQHAGPFLNARSLGGDHQTIATIHLEHDSEFAAEAVKHMDTLLALGKGNLLLSNYEAALSYFPIRLRDPQIAQLVHELDYTNSDLRPNHERRAAEFYKSMLDLHHERIDLILVLGHEPEAEKELARWYRVVLQQGQLTVMQRSGRNLMDSPLEPTAEK